MGTWNAYGNQYWPADYLIDAQRPGPLRGLRRGRLRQDRNGDPRAARRSGRAASAATGHPTGVDRAQRSRPRPRPTSAPRAPQGWLQRPDGRACTTTARRRPARWRSTSSPTAARGTSPNSPRRRSPARAIDVEFQAKNVYLVLSSPGERPLPVQVLLDGRPIPPADAGADVHGGVRHGARPAPVHARLAARATSATASTLRFAPGRQRLRVHVRLALEHASKPPPAHGARC